jgi:nucleoid DNA-binding protein
MNNKLLLQDLTDQLADAGKIKKKDAEEFLRAFFKISEDALFEDGIVKINGLGTLKLVLVDARKSVNVSTGEEFEIREHYKVSFIPDAELKNAFQSIRKRSLSRKKRPKEKP